MIYLKKKRPTWVLNDQTRVDISKHAIYNQPLFVSVNNLMESKTPQNFYLIKLRSEFVECTNSCSTAI